MENGTDEKETSEAEAEAVGGVPLNESDLLKGVKILRELIDRMQVNVIITTGGGSDNRTISVSGPDSGLLVGKKGQTLDALHFLFNRIVHRRVGIRGFIDLDVDGYRSRREKAIRKMATDLAMKAKQEGKVIPIRPMNARERRIIHMTLSEMSDIKTESEGEGKDRYVQIIPIEAKMKR